MDTIIIRLINMPETVHGVTRKDANGDYNIYINARISAEARAKAYWHEIEHIRLGHFYDLDRPISEKEMEATNYAEDHKSTIGEMAHKGISWQDETG